MYIELSLAAKNICKSNYNTNCGQCPLRPACVTYNTVHCMDDLNKQTTQINALAEQIITV